MKITKKIVCLILLVLTTFPSKAGTSGSQSQRTSYDWTRVINAIIEVESEGDAKAVSGNSCGAMQITPILVKECNEILEKLGKKKRYTLKDRFSIAKSKEMFLLIQKHSNPENNVEKAIRRWNGGPRYSVRHTQKYYNKVMKAMQHR